MERAESIPDEGPTQVQDTSLQANWLRLLEATKQEPYTKKSDQFYFARLCNAADKHKDAFHRLESHFTQQ